MKKILQKKKSGIYFFFFGLTKSPTLCTYIYFNLQLIRCVQCSRKSSQQKKTLSETAKDIRVPA